MGFRSIGATVGRAAMLACALLVTGITPLTAHASVPTQKTADTSPKIHIVPGLEEPLVATAATSAAEDQALLSAIAAYRRQPTTEDLTVFESFLHDYPDSAWRTAVLTNMGLVWYHNGYFSRAIDAWEQAWKAGRTATEPQARALADRAVGELLRMHARIGHADRLAGLFDELGDRQLSGPASEAHDGARQGLWKMRNEPGVAYLCGPMALKNLLTELGAAFEQTRFLDDYRSGPQGVTLAEVARLAERAKLPYQLAYREPGQPIPVPAVVHWKVSHFAAIVAEENGYYHLKDPTFGTDLWVSRAALESEGSGYFLIPKTGSAAGLRRVSMDEAAGIRGMGNTGSNMASATRPGDDKAKPGGCNQGMCGYNFTEMVVSLNLNDTPVGYAPPIGPAVFATLTYNQREAGQPANFSYFNVGPKWTLNWLSFIQDDPAVPGASVSRYVAGGGSVSYAGYNSGTGAFTADRKDGSVLVRTQANPITYERRLADGGVEVYAQANGAGSYPRRVFLSSVIDRFGNTANLNYDGQMRLVSIQDATGLLSTFAYNLPGRPLQVTAITDPFGRSASLQYDGSGRLTGITDVLGLTSQFAYNAASQVVSMTTPYGTTQFSFGDNGNQRFLQATDPLGYTERLEFRQLAPGIPYSDPANLVPQGIVLPFNQYLSGRNTFYWDKYAQQLAAGNYTQARIKHWTHWATTPTMTGDTVESIKYPLESRIWHNYPGQPAPGQPGSGFGTAITGSLDKPSRTARVLDDGSTQLTQYSYNTIGNPTSVTDPVGRVTQINYAGNQIDVVSVRQKTSASGYSTLAGFTYDSRHLPLTYTDAAGRTTSYAYNQAGQLLSETDALGQTTQYEYDNRGYLLRIVNPNGRTQESYSYDSYGRMATRTDSEGLRLRYEYDNFDRLTRIYHPDGTATTYTYDRLDLAAVTDRQGRTTSYEYDANRNRTDVIDPLGRRISLAYYPNGKLKSLTDGNGNTTTWQRDIQSRVTAKQFADGSQTSHAYESRTSRLKTVTDPLGQKTNRSYARDDRLTALSYSNAVHPTPSVGFTWDAYFPRRAAMSDGSGVTGYQYYPAGSLGALKLAVEDGPGAHDAIAYAYDALGRVVERGIDSSSETFAYDSLGRVIGHNSPLGNFALTYLGETGQILTRTLLDAASAACPGSVRSSQAEAQNNCTGKGNAYGIQKQANAPFSTAWEYEDNRDDRRLRQIRHSQLHQGASNNSPVTSDSARSYAYATTPEALISRLTETAATVQTRDYQYDDASRLTRADASQGSHDYRLDAADNLLTNQTPAESHSAFYNTLNQIVHKDGQYYQHDANGNLTDDGRRSYAFDPENRLIGISYPSQPGRSTVFRYDGLGRRVAIIEQDGALSGETRHLWCGETLCQARSAAGAVMRRYYDEGELADGAKLYYAQDHLGSVRDVVDANSHTLAAYDYDPYGLPTRTTGTSHTDFRYAGLLMHYPSGLYLANYRAYDPASGRWISRDPIGEEGGINLYAYVGGNPLSYVDPHGLATTVVINNNDPVIGTHAGVVVGSGGDAVLYDPGGSYRNAEKGSGDALYGRDVNLTDYVNYQRKDGPDVKTYTFPTTPAQEAAIKARIESNGSRGPGYCAADTSKALDGIGPFKGLGISITPSGLARALSGR
jgi:RHS repeat-associated protein